MEFVSRGHQVQVTLFAWTYTKKNYFFYADSQPVSIVIAEWSQLVSIVIAEWIDDRNGQSKNKPSAKKPELAKEMKIKPVTLCVHSTYNASF